MEKLLYFPRHQRRLNWAQWFTENKTVSDLVRNAMLPRSLEWLITSGFLVPITNSDHHQNKNFFLITVTVETTISKFIKTHSKLLNLFFGQQIVITEIFSKLKIACEEGVIRTISKPQIVL